MRELDSVTLFLITRRIEQEKQNITHTYDIIAKRLQSLQANPDEAYLESLVINLHALYVGLERIFKLVADKIDECLPKGGTYHRELLEQMFLEIDDLRPQLFSEEVKGHLFELKDFRHKVRHVYTFALRPDKVIALAQETLQFKPKVLESLERFSQFLKEALRLKSSL